MNTIKVRNAVKEDCPAIFEFIRGLAIYEKAEHEVKTNIATLENTLFSENPKAFSLICEQNNQPIGFAIYFYSYSTWLGKYGIYLEDLYVNPKFRNVGAGKALLKQLAKIAIDNDCGRIEWSVLDWNQSAIEFYLSLNALPQSEWTTYRLNDEAISKLASS